LRKPSCGLGHSDIDVFTVVVQIMIDNLVQVMRMRLCNIVPAYIGVQMKATQRDRQKRYESKGKNESGCWSHPRNIQQHDQGMSNPRVFGSAFHSGCPSLCRRIRGTVIFA